VDAETAPLLYMALTDAVAARPRVCCDLSAVTFFCAEGARALAAAHLQAARARGTFVVRGVQGLTAMVLESSGLRSILVILD
jgi:anti-anti-sigma factor